MQWLWINALIHAPVSAQWRQNTQSGAREEAGPKLQSQIQSQWNDTNKKPKGYIQLAEKQLIAKVKAESSCKSCLEDEPEDLARKWQFIGWHAQLSTPLVEMQLFPQNL